MGKGDYIKRKENSAKKEEGAKKVSVEFSISVSEVILAILWKASLLQKNAIFTHPLWMTFCKNKNVSTFWTSIYRLQKKNLLKENDGYYILMPLAREDALFAYTVAQAAIFRRTDNQWDGGWRMIFFDFPEVKRRHRDFLRNILKAIGFREFQRSVWVHPLTVPSFLKDFLLEDGIREHIRFVTAGKVDNDDVFKKLFKSFSTQDKLPQKNK